MNQPQFNLSNPFGIGGIGRPPSNPFAHLTPGMMPHGVNPFFPGMGLPQNMLIPGAMPNPFQQRGFPGPDPRIFDPSKPFPRPGWPGGLGGPPQLHGKRNSEAMDIDDEIGMSLDQKKLRLQSSMRMLKDEPVPEGYMRFR